MGDNVLMKTLLLMIWISTALLADANTDWVDGQVAAIKPPRKGVSSEKIDHIKDPFIITYKKSVGKKKSIRNKKSGTSKQKRSLRGLRLQAIMNGTALINGKWFKSKEMVRGYKIEKISSDSVLLRRGKEKTTRLSLATNDPKIKIQIK